ncbi:siderophore synthetase component [Geomicrobium halophilum]|uniref:Siderophore synthetase component n=1 Tax=Geomicrobium halophilum TaxID=549000 RepID=A0A841PQE3_9BACL|nr:IucA/IucC family protein [Geomicrobium halophilum]MBB6451077.1 siderophore synthetase component [Geomicrobium halophilum]
MNQVLYHSPAMSAERIVFKDLVNAFIAEEIIPVNAENLLSFRNASKEIQVLFCPEEDALIYTGALCLQLEKSKRQGVQWKAGTPVYGRQKDQWVWLETAVELANFVLRPSGGTGVENFIRSVETSVEQLALSLQQLEREQSLPPRTAYEWFMESEKIASLRDRPFHPVSKAKVGFDIENYQRYMAEFKEAIPLCWIGIANDCVVNGDVEGKPTCLDLLPEQERSVIEEEITNRGVDREQYTIIPVHPWQMSQVIEPYFQEEMAKQTILPLMTRGGNYLATSSVRSMAPSERSRNMLKLPIGVASLGAARYLPVVKLMNGISGEQLLRQAIACDDRLKEIVYVCKENAWWGYLPPSLGLFDDHPRHLAAQLREYPQELLTDDYKIIAMSSLGAGEASFAFVQQLLGKQCSKATILQFYQDIAALFYEVAMRLFKVGVVPEIHGQNCCLVFDGIRPVAILFRDHDSVRLHPPYTQQHELDNPEYLIRPGYSNSLYNDTIEELLFYVQTLGTQVNMASIMETLSENFHIPEKQFWEITEQEWKQALQAIDLSNSEKKQIHHLLFTSEKWPVKMVVRPLLDIGSVPGAMPSGKSEGVNPFCIKERSFYGSGS